MDTPIDRALDALRVAVHAHDTAFTMADRAYWASQLNQAAYEVNLQLHLTFPEYHRHPGAYRPLLDEVLP